MKRDSKSPRNQDLEILSAMLDGEASEKEVTKMLGRMEKEPELKAAWQELSILQGMVHHQPQAMTHVDLSEGLSHILRSAEVDVEPHTPTPVVSFPGKHHSESARGKSCDLAANEANEGRINKTTGKNGTK